MCRPPTSLVISHGIYQNAILILALVTVAAFLLAPRQQLEESIWNLFCSGSARRRRRTTTHPRQDDNFPEENLLTDQHLEIIALRQWTQMLSWITFHSDALGKLRDSKGQTILHHACLFKAPVLVIECILWAAPELASVTNRDGEVPLHWAVRLSSQNPVLKVLLEKDPDTAFVVDYTNSTPLAMLWEKHQKPSIEAFRYNPEAFWKGNAWKRLMSVFQAVRLSKDAEEFFPLHIAASKCTPPSLFPFMLQVYKAHISCLDGNGQTPLSIACRNPTANRSLDIRTKIEFLLDADAEQAQHPLPNSGGRFHLHYALESGIGWKDGVGALLKANPSVLSEKDPISGLYPFALAATNHSTSIEKIDMELLENHHLTAIYDLLRSDPSLLRMQVQ